MYLFRRKSRKGCIRSPLSDKIKDLTEEQIKSLVLRLKSGDSTAKSDLVQGHLRLCFVVASQYSFFYPKFGNDLLSEAVTGVCQACDLIKEMYDDNFTGFAVAKMHTRCKDFVAFMNNKILGNRSLLLNSKGGDHCPVKITYVDPNEVDIGLSNGNTEELLEDLDRSIKNYRELQIIKLLKQGYTQKEVAYQMGVSTSLVCNTLYAIEMRFNEFRKE